MYSRTICMVASHTMQKKPTKLARKGKSRFTAQEHKAPVAVNRSSRQTGTTRLRFKEGERVTTVKGAVAFTTVQSIACNPGLPGSFPWLSGHASLYERYRIHRLVYRYKNLKGTSSDGNILMSFDFDTLDNPPATAVEMTQQTCWVDGAPWRIFELKVNPVKGDLFVRVDDGPLLIGADLKTYDFGRLFVAAEGCADTSDHGYLEVDYDIELFEKQSGAGSSPLPTANFSTMNYLATPDAIGAAGHIVPFDTLVANGLAFTDDGAGTLTATKPGWVNITASLISDHTGASTKFYPRVNSTPLYGLHNDSPVSISGYSANVTVLTELAIGDTLDFYATGSGSTSVISHCLVVIHIA